MSLPPSIYALLSEAAAQRPSKKLFGHDERSFTYRESLEAVDQLAAGLKKRGVKKGDRFAIALRNSPEFVFFYFALARLGAVAVPINFLVTKTEELEFMLKDSGAVGVLTQREFLKNYKPLIGKLPQVRLWLGLDAIPEGGELLMAVQADGQAAPESGPGEAGPEDLICVLYTSGTTGVPKGAMLTHANQVSNAAASLKALAVTHKDVFIDILPLFHTFAWMACVLVPIRAGSYVEIVSSVTPPAPWLKLMGKRGVTLFAAVPQLYAVLAREAKGFKGLFLRYFSFRKTRLAVSGSAPLAVDTLQAFEQKLGVPILEGYGLTETSPVVSINRIGDRRPGKVGLPIEDVEVAILDDAEQPVAQGGEGEICVRGPNVMKGYLNRPEATAEAFTKDGRYFKTGDIGRIDEDGHIQICDRKKDMIIVKGLKVFPAQVESVLLGHPAVAEAAVVGVPEGTGGDEIIRAFVTLKEGHRAEKHDILSYLRGKLDAYKRPRDVEILDSLPKNALQKVLKRELKKLAAAKLAEAK